MLGQGTEIRHAYPGWGLLQLNPHMGLAVLIYKLHQLLGIITPDQHHRPGQPQGLLQLQEGKRPQGCCVLLLLPLVTLYSSMQPPPQTPLGTCSAAARSSVMSKRTALAPRSPAIWACRDTAEVWLGSEKTQPICALASPSHQPSLPKSLHTLLLCTLTDITLARD